MYNAFYSMPQWPPPFFFHARDMERERRWPHRTWWRHQMETFSALLALCAGNSPVTGVFHKQRPATRSFDVFFDLRVNKRLSKQLWGWWFETPVSSLRRHCNDKNALYIGNERLWGQCKRITENSKVYLGKVTKLWLSYNLVLLSTDSKTR